MKMLEQYTDPMLMGISPRTVQERKMMSKRKMLGAGIGAGLGVGLTALDQKYNPNNKLPKGAVRLANATGGALMGSIIGNYTAHKTIADQRRASGQRVYDEKDIEQEPIVSINGQIVG